MKRYISLLLTAAMLLSLLIVPASAEGTPEMELQVLSFTENLGAIVEGQPLNSAKPEDLLAVKVLFNNKTENTINFGGYAIQIEYDKDLFTPYSYNYEEEGFTSTAGPIIYSKLIQRFANESNAKKEGLCEWTGGIASPLPIDTNKTLVLGYALFKVKADVESTTTEFKFSNNSEKNFIASSKPEQGGVSDVDYVPGVSFDAAASLTINGVAPTLGKVTVTDKDNNTVLDTLNSKLKFDTLEVNGTTDYTYQARAWSTSGKEITENVTWKLKSGSIFYDELNGATISEAGLLTIPSDAGAELSVNFFSFWVVATPKDGVSGNAIETNNIQINHKEQKIKTIQIRRKDGETGELIIPGKDEAPATAEFVATCTNQYGRPYEGDQTVYWNYERVGSQYGVNTVGFINTTATGATLKAEAGAADSVTDSATLKVKAYAGDINDRVYSNEVEITVQRDNVQRPARIEISGGPEGSTLAVPKTGDPTATANATYTATVYDQYGTEIADPGAISWYLEADDESQPFGTGNESQFIVMKEAAQTFAEGSTSRDVTVKATCGGVFATTTLTLTREKARAMRIAMEDITIAVPKSGEANVTRSYLEVYDQYDIKMGSPTFEKTTTPNTLNGVTFTDDKITVSSDAAGNDFNEGKCQFTLTITCNSASTDIVSKTKTITLTRDSAEAKTMIWGTTGTFVEVPANDSGKADANVTVTVYDQYGQPMPDAKVELDGEQEGFVWENGLKVTKAAVKYFKGERKESVTVNVNLKSGNATATAKVTLKLEDAYTNRQSAEITGQANITKPTDNTPNTAVYSILNNEMKDQYGLPITFEPSKLTMTLEDKEDESGFSVKDGPVTLSGPVDGKWTITVTSGAVVNTKYYLKAKYSDMQCAPVMKITITDKAVSETPLTVVQGDITYGTAVSPSVSNKPKTAGTITYTYVGRDGTTYAKSTTKPTNAGKYTVIATCEDANYIYTGSVDFQILPKEIKVDWIELDGTRYTYNGQQQTVKYTVKDGNTTLVKDRDYTVEGDKQTNAGVHLLEITGKGNYYSDPDATVPTSVTWNIWALPVKIDTATFKPRGYAKDNYSAVLDTLTLVADKDGVVMPDNLTEGNGFTVSDIRVANNNAGQQPVSFKVTLTNTNYKWAVAETGNIFNVPASAGFTVEITPADHAPVTVPPVSGKYGNQLAMDLAQYLEGGSAAVGTITDNENILDAVEGGAKAIVQNGKLWLQLTKNPTKVGKSATVTLTVNSTNYNPFTITVTVTVQNKKTQTVTANDLNVTYGDAGVKLNASALDNAKLTYQVTEGADVVAVDANGNVTLRKSGTAKIQITAAETEDYGTANTTVTVTVAKRSLTVKANDLTAYVGGQLPALDYTVTGLVSGDTLTTVPELELKDVPVGVDPMKTAGTYTIGFKTAPVADKDKYDLTVETGTLTVSSRPNVNPVPAGNSVKLEEAAGGKLTSSVSRATKGTTVTITVKPDAGYQLEELEVLDKNGEALPLKELANGKFSFQMPDSKVTVQASFVQESTYAGYPDVLPQDWFYSSVRYVTERGLMKGTPNGFEPNMDSSRATIWTILARFSGVDTTVVSGEWYAVARQWAMENGVSDGTNPNGVITREQLATMLYRFAKNKGLVQEPVTADLSVFVDAGQISDYALDAMRWAVSVGLLNGMDGSRLAPQGSAARAQVAAMLMRFDQLAK